MGAYLDRLREFQKPSVMEPNKPKKTPKGGSFGFLGSTPELSRELHRVNHGSWCAWAKVAIEAWLTSIDEDNPELVRDILTKCRLDPDSLEYYLWRAAGGD